MNIRRANVVDIERCARLSGDYRTQHVWQMDENRSADAVGRPLSPSTYTARDRCELPAKHGRSARRLAAEGVLFGSG